jgi:hypothetical protein
MDYVFSLDTAAGPDYGNALVHTCASAARTCWEAGTAAWRCWTR